MKAVIAEYDREEDDVRIRKDAQTEDWVEVCRRYNDDVERLRDVSEVQGFTALYECFDEKNQSVFYLVEEDSSLYRLRRKHFLENIGQVSGPS